MLSFYQKLAGKLNDANAGAPSGTLPVQNNGARTASFKATGERIDAAHTAADPQPAAAGAVVPVTKSDPAPEGTEPLDIDLYQSDQRMVICAQLPGVSGDGLGITIDEESNTVIIEAEPKAPSLPVVQEGDGEKGRYLKQETKWKKLYRKVYLPAPFDGGGAKAALDRGVLTVELPFKRPGEGKKLAVKEISSDELRQNNPGK